MNILEDCSQNMIENVIKILTKGLFFTKNEETIALICNKSWNLVLETKNDAPLSIPISFMKLAFNDFTISLKFTPALFAKVLAKGIER